MVAKVILNRTAHALDAAFDYIIPPNMNVSVGMRVVVPFGNGNKSEEGYVIGIADKSEFKKLKPITSLVDDFIYFDEKGVSLAEFMRYRYFSKYSDCIKCLLPPSINLKFKSVYSIGDILNDKAREIIEHSVVYENIVKLILEKEKVSFEDISANLKGKNIKSAILKLKENGIIEEKIIVGQNIKDAEKTVVKPLLEREYLYSWAVNASKKAPKQSAIIETVCDNDSIYLSELLEICDTTHSTVNTLVKKGLIYLDKEVVRTDIIDNIEYCEKHITLSDEQKSVVVEIGKDIEKDEYSPYLLHGVTGSGKTEVYLNLVEKCISSGKNAVFLVPEISLTPQMIRQVVSRFGESVAVLHSSLTLRERYDQWKKIKTGEVNVVVGARSAVFAPFDDIGLIIVDEEHESSYKSEISPKYSTVEVAKFRAKQNNAVLLLASATPSIETYFESKNGRIKLLTLENRINDSKLPEVQIIDMREDLKNGNTGVLSETLKKYILENLKSKLKTILFLNRRGYSGFIQCRSCGNVIECPNCNIAMTYHRNNSNLVCHYCDYKMKSVNVCPKCGSEHIKFGGDGTQKVEDEIEKLFPDARVLRMDADTTSSRNAHEKILDEFSKDESDILVGTQMVTKGLDFEKVTLVGVLSADMSLNIDDFRSDEKTFDLITQVCGRAGRGKYDGRAVIQTYDTENETIKFSSRQDYINFYNHEIEVRKTLSYPPFCEIINFVFTSENEECAHLSATNFHNLLRQKLEERGKLNYVIAYKVMPAPLHKINGNYRYRFIMKLSYSKDVYNAIHDVANQYRKDKNNANLSIDINPYNLS